MKREFHSFLTSALYVHVLGALTPWKESPYLISWNAISHQGKLGARKVMGVVPNEDLNDVTPDTDRTYCY
jgi:hypothetical protein